MAQRLAKMFGTEMDKVNCPFFYKIGACRYGDSCERIHNKPPISETILLEHLYENNSVEVALISGQRVTDKDATEAVLKFEVFYQGLFNLMIKYGEVEDIVVVDNMGDHLVGNVYVKYADEDFAQNAYTQVNGRYFNGKMVVSVYSPVTDFQNAKCKQHIEGLCKRGGYCNYMHLKPISTRFKSQLQARMFLEYPKYKARHAENSDGRDQDRDRDRDDDKKRDRKDKDKDRERDHKERNRSKQIKDKDGDRSRDRDRDRDRERDRDRDRPRHRDSDKEREKDSERQRQRKSRHENRSNSRDSRSRKHKKRHESRSRSFSGQRIQDAK